MYSVMIEQAGKTIHVGQIDANGFAYSPGYLQQETARPISISLPLQREAFSPERTKCFFDGLLPEGFTRRTVAQWMHVPEDDYLSILAGLGRECLGAIQIVDGIEIAPPEYRKLTLAQVQELAAEGASRSAKLVTESRLSLTGASGKVGLYYDAPHDVWYQPFGIAPSTHIVKQSHVRLGGMVVNELLCLKTAKKCGITVPDCFILSAGGVKDENILFATTRYDRTSGIGGKIDGLPCPARLHQEDFAQAMGICAAEKYEPKNGSYLRDMFTLLKQYAQNPLEDSLRLWDLTVFNYLIGNTDSHLKNYSLLYDASLSALSLAPAYDIVSTTIYESSTRKLSMRIGEATTMDSVCEDSFCTCAKEVGLGTKMAMKRLSVMMSKFIPALNATTEELMGQGFINAAQIRDRILKTGGFNHLAK